MIILPEPPHWQWSVEIPGVLSTGTVGAPRAFLWVPPLSERIAGIVVSQQSMQEEPILEHHEFRDTLAQLRFGAIWITPPLDLTFDVTAGAGRHFEAMLKALADKSGYAELTALPMVPLGHSAAAGFPWRFARWAPERTLAVISISGEWPYPSDEQTAIVRDPALGGIPGLVIFGEYEWAQERVAEGLKQRAADATLPLTMLAEAGGGQFDLSSEKISYLALYLRKAALYRLPVAGGTELQFIDPETHGWLVDGWRGDEPPRVPAAPVAEYAEPEEAFWCFDEEHARATERFRADQRGKRHALVGYVQNGSLLPQVPGSHQQVTIPFQPERDDLTFRLQGDFLATVPQGRPERWTGRQAGSAIGRPIGRPSVTIDRICGPLSRIDATTFSIRFSRACFNNPKYAGEIWLSASHQGDDQFRRSVQQALLRIPLRHTEGPPQQIDFAPLPDLSVRDIAKKSISLIATTNAPADRKELVRFYVLEGPALIANDSSLTFLTIPVRARLPLQVTVVAWQWGRSIEPKLQSAEPVTRTFRIVA